MSTSTPPLRSYTEPPVSTLERPPLSFLVSRRAESGGSIRLILSGELDLAARPHFESALDAAQDDSERVLLDLRALALIDCAGLATIFAAAARAHRELTVLILLDPRGQVRRVLDVVGVPPEVEVIDQVDRPGRLATVAA